MKAKLIKDDNIYGLKDGDKIIGTSDFQLNMLLNYPFKLSPKNCEAIKRGYPFDEYEEAIAYAGEYGHPSPEGFSDEQIGRLHGFIDGFQKALELMGDKKFSEEDIRQTLYLKTGFDKDGFSFYKSDEEIIQSLQQTEWDCIIEMENISDGLDEMAQPQYIKQPKLDADGCLILKRI